MCPKECEILHYEASMSYAAANQNSENRYDLSERYRVRTGKQLKDSLDIMENVLSDRRRKNREDFYRLIDFFSFTSDISSRDGYLSKQVQFLLDLDRELMSDFIDFCDTVMVAAFKMMEHVLRNDFIVAWDEMDLKECVRGSLSLCETIRKSIDMNFQDSWLPSLHFRLEEKLVASNRALYNLERVHSSYSNAVPLLNYSTTSNASFDAFYLTATLFNETKEEREVYSRLVGHINMCRECLEGLIRIYCDVGQNVSKYTGEIINHSNDLKHASIEYVSQLNVYESLVIRQPLQRVIKAKETFEHYKSRPGVYAAERSTNIEQLNSNFEELHEKTRDVLNTNLSSALGKYAFNLKYRNASKTDVTNLIMSKQLPQMLEDTLRIEIKYAERFTIIKTQMTYFDIWRCQCIDTAKSEPLLMSFYTNVYNHYNATTSSDRAAMRKYFKFLNSNGYYFDHSPLNLLLCGETNNTECSKITTDIISDAPDGYDFFPLYSLSPVSSIMKRLELFLDETRMDGSFFRYVFIIIM